MGQKSSISRLPLPVKKAIDDALKTDRFTIDEILASIREQFGAEAAPSRSTLGRYKLRFEELGQRLRESREVASIWAEKLGSEPQGDLGRVVLELLRNLAFEASIDLHDASVEGVNPKTLNALALAVHRLETAGRHSLEREKQMRKAALEEAAQAAEKLAKKGGVSPELQEEIKRSILGIGA